MVDFKKMMEEREARQNNAIVPYQLGGLTIETVDGERIQIQSGNSGNTSGSTNVVDLLPGGAGGQALPRFTAGQPRDSRWPDGSNQIFLIETSEAVNEQGEKEKIKSFVGPFGPRLVVRPVGYAVNRSLMPKFDPNSDDNKPLCRSENFIVPDAQYTGKYSTQCCRLDPRSGRVTAVCPMAQWGEKDERTGKSTPPQCSETYVIAVAIKFDGDEDWTVAECYFKSASAAAGKTLIQQLRGLELKGLPLYSYPLELLMKEAGIGNTYIGRLMLPGLFEEGTPLLPDSAEIGDLEAGVERWKEALKVRAERSAYVPLAQDGEAQGPVVTSQEPAGATSTQVATTAPAAKKSVKPLI